MKNLKNVFSSPIFCSIFRKLQISSFVQKYFCFLLRRKQNYVCFAKQSKRARMGGTAKPLPLSLAKLCSSCGRKTTRRLLRSQAKKSATETTLEEEAKARIERRRRKKGSSITLLSSIPFTIFFSRL